MIQVIELYPGVTLRCFQDNRFKQGILTIQFIRKLCAEESALNALIPAVLLQGTTRYPDLRKITLHLDDLYGASVGALVRKIGNCQTTGLSCGFMEDRFALEGDKILEPVIDFLGQLLFDPVLENGCFREDYLESEKKNLIQAIDAMRNDKRQHAANQLLRKMSAGDPFSVPRLGTKEAVSAITARSAYDHYRKILTESPVQIFYVGSAQPEKVAALLKPLFTQCRPGTLPVQTGLTTAPAGEFTEEMDVTQGKLGMGYVSPITLRDPRFAAMQVLNTILGGGMTSKLFMQVREKESLCYDISSGYYGVKGILTVSAGIEFAQKDAVIEKVRQQLDACRTGDFTDEELHCAKQALLTQLESAHDSPGAIENYYSSGVLSGLNKTTDQHKLAVEQVTAQQVQEAAQTLQEHTIYFLRGKC